MMPSAQFKGMIRPSTSSMTPDSALVISLALRSFHERVWSKLEATTDGSSILLTGTSVG